MRWLWLMLALLMPAPLLAQDEDGIEIGETKRAPGGAADEVLKAFRAGADLRALAETDDPDPWRVADELCGRGEHDAAEAFAKAAPRKDTDRLPEYVAQQRAQPSYAAAREVRARLLRGGEARYVLRLLDGLEVPPVTVLGIDLGSLRGAALRALGDWEAYNRSLETAAIRAERIGWLAGAAWARKQCGRTAMERGDYHRGRTQYEKALELEERRGNGKGIAAATGNIGVALRALGSPREARPLMERALELSTKLEDVWGMAFALKKLGQLDVSAGNYDRALHLHRRALDLLTRAAKHRLIVAEILLSVGEVQSALGDHPKALETYRRARQEFELLENERGRGAALRGISAVHGHLGQYRESIRQGNEALLIYRKLNRRHGVASCRVTIGSAHRQLGDYASALAHLDEARRVFEEMAIPGNLAIALEVLGNIHGDLGDQAAAVSCLRRSLANSRSLGKWPLVASTLSNLGASCFQVGDYRAALQHWEEALEVAEEHDLDTGTILNNLGYLHAHLGDHEKARRLCERAVESARRRGELGSAATALHSLGLAHELSGALVDAQRAYDESLKLSRKSGRRLVEIECLAGLARVHLVQGDARAALRQARQAVRVMRHVARGLAEEETAGLLSEMEGANAAGVRAGVALRDARETAFFLENGRSTALLQMLSLRGRLQEAVIPADLSALEAKARAHERVALWRYRRAFDKGDDVEALWADVQAARGEIVAAVRRIQREAKAQAALLYPEADSLDDIRAALREGEALVLYGLLKKDAVALVVTAKKARIVELGATGPIVKTAEAFQRAVSRPDERGMAPAPHETFGYLAKRLRKLVVEPLKLKAKRVLVSPDGQLSYVPFAVLTDRAVAYVPSGTTYRLLLEERSLRGDKVLALGHPDYGVKPDEKELLVMRGGAALSALPATKEEVEAIGDTLLLGKHATVAGFREAVGKQKRWRAVHLACHGRIDPERPVLSSLALTGGFLKCLDVYRMKIPADLAVLSACETAKGKIYRAEGVIGFTRAFLFAGCPRVLVSLWKVDDEATRALMVKFYELWKDGEVGAADALKQAQAHVAAQPKWNHPYFWGAWQLWGLAD